MTHQAGREMLEFLLYSVILAFLFSRVCGRDVRDSHGLDGANAVGPPHQRQLSPSVALTIR